LYTVFFIAFDEAIAGVLIRDLDGVVVIFTTEEQGIWAESVRSRIYTHILSTLTAVYTTKSGNGIKSEFAINDTGDSNTTTEESVFCSFTRGSCVSVTARVILAPKLPRNLYYAIISDRSVSAMFISPHSHGAVCHYSTLPPSAPHFSLICSFPLPQFCCPRSVSVRHGRNCSGSLRTGHACRDLT
jgi:hypothetical protein